MASQCGNDFLAFLLAQVATLGKSGVSVGYYDTEEAGARAYDRASIGLLGRNGVNSNTNFPLSDYAQEEVYANCNAVHWLHADAMMICPASKH